MFKKLKDKLHRNDDATTPPIEDLPSSSPQPSQQGPAKTEKPNSILQQETYLPPPGPPPTHITSSPTYAPPPGPPPFHSSTTNESQPYHPWTSIPDTALLPPPPSFTHTTSPTANASASSGNLGLAWTRTHPLSPPTRLSAASLDAIATGCVGLISPPHRRTFVTAIGASGQEASAPCSITTKRGCEDSCYASALPLYAALHDSPLHSPSHAPKTVYFEVCIRSLGIQPARPASPSSFPWRAKQRREALSRTEATEGEIDAGVAIGFIAPPYPLFRLPGWERGSLGVHSDDGRRYVNDGSGGVDFVAPFYAGDTVGIGMTFSVPARPPAYEDVGSPGLDRTGEGKLDIEVFFTRNGVKEGCWDGSTEMDEQSEGGNEGLIGERDLFAAVGVFGVVDLKVVFEREGWAFDPFRGKKGGR